MVMKKVLFLFVCAMAMTFSLPSHAQRLIPKQKGMEVVGSVPLIKGEKLFAKDNFGVGVSLTRYLKRENYAFVGIEYEQQNVPYRDYGVKLKDALLHLGYMHPILSDKGKNVFLDRKSTRLNSSHANISYAVFCLKKKKKTSSRTCHRIIAIV